MLTATRPEDPTLTEVEVVASTTGTAPAPRETAADVPSGAALASADSGVSIAAAVRATSERRAVQQARVKAIQRVVLLPLTAVGLTLTVLFTMMMVSYVEQL